ncbi:ArsR/SmtB family transcription factor [Microbacterium nymphoidis]|uniref:ArsR/SmtB family transcription factor n=1 Tax=Microbacterium nymphoidis TaxID=2898586 RepID=UPI001E6476BD|nr:helix-turn-helix domain-containing protein [Microbacterium nymphoidis]MCD2497220.1 helix-turn-helix domain-containing protein [Microbacterium nymphoidis]
MSNNEGAERREIAPLSSAAMRALSHPLRVEIIDILGQRGPQTASSLGRLVGESSGATSYHLRALAKHGIVVEVPDRGSARERWWDVDPDGLRLDIATEATSPAGRAAAEILTTEMFRRRNAQLMDFLRASTRGGADFSDRDATLATSNMRLTLEQFAVLRDELEAVLTRAKAMAKENGETGGVLYSVRTDVFPLVLDDAPESRHNHPQHPTTNEEMN